MVRANVAPAETPATFAVTLYGPPCIRLATNGVDATPEVLVVTVTVCGAPKYPVAPLVGAVNVTGTPLTALPPASFTVADSAVANGSPAAALCGVPPVAVMLAGGPGVLVSAKVALTPLTAAVTL